VLLLFTISNQVFSARATELEVEPGGLDFRHKTDEDLCLIRSAGICQRFTNSCRMRGDQCISVVEERRFSTVGQEAPFKR
jgi:hypothetical protein